MMQRPFDVFLKYIPSLKKSHADEYKACCPFHKEDKPSFFVNSTTGQYICFGCGVTGNVYTFLESIGHPEEKSAINRSYVDFSPDDKSGIDYINPVVVEQFSKNLIRDTHVLEYVMRVRLVSLFTIKKYQIGYDPLSDRIAFPIKTFSGKIINIKLHNSFSDPKSYYYSSKNGGKKLFPATALLKQDVVLCEGEFDCMALHSIGINAVTSTSGVASFQEDWVSLFKDKNVKICYDNDEPGNFYAGYTASMLKNVCRVEVITLPKDPDVKKVDVTDILQQKKDVFKILKLQRKF